MIIPGKSIFFCLSNNWNEKNDQMMCRFIFYYKDTTNYVESHHTVEPDLTRHTWAAF